MSDPAQLIQIRGRHVVVSTDEGAIEAARRHFEERWFLRLPALLDPPTLERVMGELEQGALREKVHPGIGVESCFLPDKTLARLEFQLADARVLAFVERVAGVSGIGHFLGRVYRVQPGAGHYDDWHDDVSTDGTRRAALTLNLGRSDYVGSTLEIRSSAGGPSVLVPNHTPGDAVLFRLADGLEHRITPIEGAVPKTAMAGWFRLGREDLDVIRQAPRGHAS